MTQDEYIAIGLRVISDLGLSPLSKKQKKKLDKDHLSGDIYLFSGDYFRVEGIGRKWEMLQEKNRALQKIKKNYQY